MNITGDWRLNLESPFGMQTPILTLLEDAGKFSGELKSHMGNVKFENGTVDGNNLNWELKMKAMGITVKLGCIASVDENNISGKMTSRMGTYNFTGESLGALPNGVNTVVSGYQKAINNLEMELKILKLHTAALSKAECYKGQKGLKINAGSGYNVREGWVNLDMSSKADLQLDLREPMPFEDGCASIVYSEHLFEHLEYPDEACTFLSESFRILEEGGEFSVGVPDTEWPVVSYVNGDDEYFDHAKSSFRPPWCKTRMQSVNYHFRQSGDHKYAYDYETLELVLREAGFSDIAKRAFNPKLDNASREIGTLYVSAFKSRAKSS